MPRLDSSCFDPRARFRMLAAVAILVGLTACSTSRAYRDRLVTGAEYAYEQPPFHIQFTHTTPDHPELVALRHEFDLDGVAGKGSDRERMLRLLDWAYRVAAWDGSAPWPEGTLSATNIIAWTREHESGVNCRMQAIILTEALLAVGIPARIVGCTPIDPQDRDSHVIVSAWSSEEQRWLWLDPSFNAIPIGHGDRHLGVREVRSMLVNGQTPTLNSEARLRDQPMDANWYFGTYMTKNLYGLVSPLHSQPGREGSAGQKEEVILLPALILPDNAERRVRNWEFRGGNYTQYAISNPDLFWAAPMGYQ